MYKIEVKKSVLKKIKILPREDQIKIAKTIKVLSKNPRSMNAIKLVNSQYFRVRCGRYRIIYEIQDQKLLIIILKVGHRKDIYKG